MSIAQKRPPIGTEFVFFFGIGHPLSQWHPCQFTVNGITFSCAEQFMMHAKARHFGDLEIASKILATNDPGEQKKLGRQVRDYVEAEWNLVDTFYVFRGNLAKFTQGAELQRYLIGTGSKYLVEASRFDRKWGVGLEESNPAILDPANWEGENRLGDVLMQVRDVLLEAQQARQKNYAPPNP